MNPDKTMCRHIMPFLIKKYSPNYVDLVFSSFICQCTTVSYAKSIEVMSAYKEPAYKEQL